MLSTPFGANSADWMPVKDVQKDPVVQEYAPPAEGWLEEGARAAATLTLCGGLLCLDFANTVSARGTEDARDVLDDYTDLLAWSVHAGALAAEAAAPLARHAQDAPARAAAIWARARLLREAIVAILAAHAAARTPDAASLRRLNNELGPALAHLQLRAQASAHAFAWHWAEPPAALDRPLWPIAHSAAELLTSDELAHVRTCAGDTCGWLFVDRSKNHSRRWCDMKECGNVAKVRRYRTRRNATTSE